MDTFTCILVGTGIGLAASVTAWFLTLAFLAPRVRIEERRGDEGDVAWPAYQFGIASRRWRRDLIDVQVHCNLRIPHHATQENALGLKVSSGSFAFVRAGWIRLVTVSMETSSLDEGFGRPQLERRLGELHPSRRPSDISSLREVFSLFPGSRLEVIVLASDPLSGVRRAIRGSLIPRP
jgi:hypothetical protein